MKNEEHHNISVCKQTLPKIYHKGHHISLSGFPGEIRCIELIALASKGTNMSLMIEVSPQPLLSTRILTGEEARCAYLVFNLRIFLGTWEPQDQYQVYQQTLSLRFLRPCLILVQENELDFVKLKGQ